MAGGSILIVCLRLTGHRIVANNTFLDRVTVRTGRKCRVLKISFLFHLDFADVIGSREGADFALGFSLILLYDFQGPYHSLSFWNSTLSETDFFRPQRFGRVSVEDKALTRAWRILVVVEIQIVGT